MTTSNNQPTLVLVITNDERVNVVIKAAISKELDFTLPGRSTLSEGYLESAKAHQPGIIILGFSV